ncbi:hypothetical protein [Streptomyces sp. NPDC048577]|uniref:hypothetical protein n=1 Tax=Streptomyces sp. NPDC048577 TaxID=3157209 RepID=UPI00341B63C3
MTCRVLGPARRPCDRWLASVEHGFAHLKSWRVLTKVRMNGRHASAFPRALLVLAGAEVDR